MATIGMCVPVVCSMLPDRARRVVAAEHRHLHVHQNQIEGLAAVRVDRRLAVRRHRHLMSESRQERHGDLLVDHVVFGQQDSERALGCRRARLERWV